MTNVPNAPEVAVSAPEPTPAPRAEAFGLVTAGIRVGGLPIPEQVMMHGFRSLILLVDAEDPAAVDRWATYLGLARPRLDDYVHTTGTRRWKTYGVRGDHPRLAGWDVTVYCTVTEPAGEQPESIASAQELQVAGVR